MLTYKEGRAYKEFKDKVRTSFNASHVTSKREYCYDKDGEKFEGIVDNMDRQTGYGRIEYRNGDSYEGYWWLGEYDGPGRKEYANGDWYDGEWEQDKMHGQGKYNLVPRDWSETPRSQWSTGKDWTFEGTFAKDRAVDGIFKDGIQNGTKVTRLKFEKPVEMDRFWIQSKLSKDDEEVTQEERRAIILPEDLYKSPTPTTQHHTTEEATQQRRKLKDLKPLTPEQYEVLKAKTIQSLLQQLLLLT